MRKRDLKASLEATERALEVAQSHDQYLQGRLERSWKDRRRQATELDDARERVVEANEKVVALSDILGTIASYHTELAEVVGEWLEVNSDIFPVPENDPATIAATVVENAWRDEVRAAAARLTDDDEPLAPPRQGGEADTRVREETITAEAPTFISVTLSYGNLDG